MEAATFSVRVTTMVGTSVVLDELTPLTRLIQLKRRLAEELRRQTGAAAAVAPWYELALALRDEAWGLRCDGRTLESLGVIAAAELLCVRQSAWTDGVDGWIDMAAAAGGGELQRSTFVTHDNGGRPFAVVLRPHQEKNVEVVALLTGETVLSAKALAVFAGRWTVAHEDGGEGWGDGNSVLLHLPSSTDWHRYAFVGHAVYFFETPPHDPILRYFSELGTSDVPYPVALGAERVYFMLDQHSIAREALEPEDFDAWESMYGDYYCSDVALRRPFARLSLRR